MHKLLAIDAALSPLMSNQDTVWTLPGFNDKRCKNERETSQPLIGMAYRHLILSCTKEQIGLRKSERIIKLYPLSLARFQSFWTLDVKSNDSIFL